MIDPRIERGTRAMLELRRDRIAAGERPVGWKVGFGAPAAKEMLAIDRPLVGFLTDRGRLEDGAEVAIGDWASPRLEPEIAVELARDVPGDATWEAVHNAIGGLAPAIELADLDPPPSDVEAILATNIYHRHFIVGPVDPGRTTAAGVSGRVLRDGEEIAATDMPETMTGEIVEVIRLTAELLAAAGERLRAGDVVITGSVVPALEVAPGARFTVEIDPLGAVTVALR